MGELSADEINDALPRSVQKQAKEADLLSKVEAMRDCLDQMVGDKVSLSRVFAANACDRIRRLRLVLSKAHLETYACDPRFVHLNDLALTIESVLGSARLCTLTRRLSWHEEDKRESLGRAQDDKITDAFPRTGLLVARLTRDSVASKGSPEGAASPEASSEDVGTSTSNALATRDAGSEGVIRTSGVAPCRSRDRASCPETARHAVQGSDGKGAGTPYPHSAVNMVETLQGVARPFAHFLKSENEVDPSRTGANGLSSTVTDVDHDDRRLTLNERERSSFDLCSSQHLPASKSSGAEEQDTTEPDGWSDDSSERQSVSDVEEADPDPCELIPMGPSNFPEEFLEQEVDDPNSFPASPWNLSTASSGIFDLTRFHSDSIVEGWVWKRSRYLKRWRRRYVVLTSSVLASYRAPGDVKATETVTAKDFKAAYSADQLVTQKKAFCVETSSRRYFMVCDDEPSKVDWIRSVAAQLSP